MLYNGEPDRPRGIIAYHSLYILAVFYFIFKHVDASLPFDSQPEDRGDDPFTHTLKIIYM